jgi:SSS family solute:Na+ symporter
VTLSLAVILGYTGLMLALGFYLGRGVRGSGDFFVAGRALGPGLLCATLLAANIGAGSTVGAAGLAYRDGVAAWWWVASAAVGSLALALWVGPEIRDVAARHDLRTVGDFLELRFDRRVRAVAALLVWVGSLAILAAQLIALAWILGVLAGLPKWAGCVLGGGLVSAYFAAGGLVASVRVNVVQLAVKLFGLGLAVSMGFRSLAGTTALAALPGPATAYWSPWQSGDSGWTYLALLAPAFVVSPGLLQKVYGARDARSVRWGVSVNALGLLLYAGVPVAIGMIARARFPALPSPEMALPTLLAEGLPPLAGAVGLAAVFSAELSAADAVLFMLTTSLAQDLYRRFIAPQAKDTSLLAVSRATAVVAGAVATGLAIVSPSVVGALSVFYTLLTVSLFVPIVAGLFLTRARAVDALAAMAGGVLCVLALRLGVGGRGVQGLSPAALGLTASTLAFLASLGLRSLPASPGVRRGSGGSTGPA